MFVTINEPRLRHSYYPRSISYSDVLHLCLMFFPCSRILSRTPHYVKSSCLLLAATVCQTSLVFDDFDSYEEYRSVILQRALLLELVWCISHDWSRVVCSRGGEDHRGEAPLHHAFSRRHTSDMTYHRWRWPRWSDWGTICRILHCEVNLPPVLPHCLFGKKSQCAANTWEVRSYSFLRLGQGNFINYLKFFCIRDVYPLPCLCIQSFIYISMDSWICIFILWVIIYYYFIYFMLQLLK